MRTQKHFQIAYGWTHKILTVPKGARIMRARNLPDDSDAAPLYWVQPWRGMPADARSWCESYGFLIGREQVNP